MKHIYKFSIVTAVYNTAEYLEEMIESVLNQDIGFKENVQLILVDDGSSDDSLSICREYESKYPNNINVLSLDHSGVSCARNEGLKLVTGKYVNFLDSDDKLESNVLSEVEKFFREYEDRIDLVAIPLYFFDKEECEHILNYKFKESRIIDICKEYKNIQLSSSSTFINGEYLQNHHLKFNKRLIYAEDAEFITKIVMNTGCYGVLKSTKYLYRRRSNETSTIQMSRQDVHWFLDYIEKYSLSMLNNYRDRNERIPRYIQYLIVYDLQWRINKVNLLNNEQKKKFYSLLKKVLVNIDFKIIIEQRNLTIKSIIKCLAIKYFI